MLHQDTRFTHPRFQPDVPGKWIQRQFYWASKNRITIGYFCCDICDKVWMSNRSQKQFGQQCKKCMIYMKPMFLWWFYYRNKRKDPNKVLQNDPSKSHLSDLCEACKLGKCGFGEYVIEPSREQFSSQSENSEQEQRSLKYDQSPRYVKRFQKIDFSKKQIFYKPINQILDELKLKRKERLAVFESPEKQQSHHKKQKKSQEKSKQKEIQDRSKGNLYKLQRLEGRVFNKSKSKRHYKYKNYRPNTTRK